MVDIKNPLFSFDARGTIGKAISFAKRRGQNIAEKKPIPKDAKTSNQLAWRTMYQLCVDLWHTLSAAEKQEWESSATPRHMTGYAWYLSQCLRPNPGVYLPLLGGTMQGAIGMASFQITDLPAPGADAEAATKKYVDDLVAVTLFDEGARVYRNVAQSIPDSTVTSIAFGNTRWDTDNIHDEITNNSRLTCRTEGLYLIIYHIRFDTHAVGMRGSWILFNGADTLVRDYKNPGPVDFTHLQASTLWNMAVGDFIELQVWQTSGAPLDIEELDDFSPEFMMQRVGP